MVFTADEERRIQAAAEQLERKTGVQVLAAVVGKTDSYPEAPWKAFALAAALTALLLTISALLDPPWLLPLDAVFYAVSALGVGALAALLCTLVPAFARCFVSAARREGEVDQYARAFFLERELFRTRERTGILLLVSLFERKVVILPDSGVAGRLDAVALGAVVSRMTPHLSRGSRVQAFTTGLAALEAALLTAGFQGAPGAPDEIAEEFVEDKGVDA